MVTKITLKKASSSDGINYSQAVFKNDRLLTAQEKQALAPMVEQMKEMASNLTPSALMEDDVICKSKCLESRKHFNKFSQNIIINKWLSHLI